MNLSILFRWKQYLFKNFLILMLDKIEHNIFYNKKIHIQNF